VIDRVRVMRLGLGLLAGAVLLTPRGTSAQVTPRDTTRADTTRPPSAVPLPVDSTRARHDSTKVPKDTIKAPLTQAENPTLVDIGQSYRWDRKSFFTDGSLTLIDLIRHVPGVTIFRSGYLASPMQAAYLGDPARIRVYMDGVEIDALDQRDGGLLDLGEVQLFTLQDVTVERGADELRVYLRTWTVDRTTPSARIDVTTGDQGSNLYRGFFGKRFKHGELLQLGLQQYSTNTDPHFGGGDQLVLFGRLGWAKRDWSADLFYMQSSRNRDPQQPFFGEGAVSRLSATRTDGYLRVGFRDPSKAGPWVQGLAALGRFHEGTAHGSNIVPDTADTTNSVPQYVVTGGYNLGRARFSVGDRIHSLGGHTLNALLGRASYESEPFTAAFSTEQRTGDTTSVEEVSARVQPFDFLALSGAAARRHGGGIPTSNSLRGEAALRFHRLWLGGGWLRRAATDIAPILVFDTAQAVRGLGPVPAEQATGYEGFIRGKVYQDIGVDIWGIRWSAPGWYRPETQSHVQVYLNTEWRRRFPSGHFGFLGSVTYEYRSNTLFPLQGEPESFTSGSSIAEYGHLLRSRVEVKIVDGYLFWEQAWSLNPPQLYQVPGFILPRTFITFGVRWSFWN